eukprot:GHVU01178316.1.p1 GENE.GHVU01178316.1~~GHVU01178316.1.p1  ORF type:complete len:143 (+),score=1.63 GHVU01178316.1:326-754(+)
MNECEPGETHLQLRSHPIGGGGGGFGGSEGGGTKGGASSIISRRSILGCLSVVGDRRCDRFIDWLIAFGSTLSSRTLTLLSLCLSRLSEAHRRTQTQTQTHTAVRTHSSSSLRRLVGPLSIIPLHHNEELHRRTPTCVCVCR